MGTSTDAILFYGFPLTDSETEYRFEYQGDSPEEGTLAWLRYHGKEDGGIEIGVHCSYSSPEYFLAPKASVQTAWRGHVADAKFGVDPVWDDQLIAFCEKHKLPWYPPKWCLVSLWGV